MFCQLLASPNPVRAHPSAWPFYLLEPNNLSSHCLRDCAMHVSWVSGGCFLPRMILLEGFEGVAEEATRWKQRRSNLSIISVAQTGQAIVCYPQYVCKRKCLCSSRKQAAMPNFVQLGGGKGLVVGKSLHGMVEQGLERDTINGHVPAQKDSTPQCRRAQIRNQKQSQDWDHYCKKFAAEGLSGPEFPCAGFAFLQHDLCRLACLC